MFMVEKDKDIALYEIAGCLAGERSAAGLLVSVTGNPVIIALADPSFLEATILKRLSKAGAPKLRCAAGTKSRCDGFSAQFYSFADRRAKFLC